MKCRAQSVVVLLVFAAICISQCFGERAKRHVKPRPNQPLTLRVLGEQCSQHGWTECRKTVELMLNESSETNRKTTDCLNEVQLQRSVQIHLKSQTNGDEVSVASDSSESQLQSSVQSNTDATCTVTMKQKREARHNYCSRFSLISLIFVYAHMDFDPYLRRGLRGLTHCVDYYDSDDLLSPDELITSLSSWYNSMTSTHRCCSNYEDTGFFPLFDNHDSTAPLTCPEYSRPSDSSSPQQPDTKLTTNHWDRLLSKVARLMREVKCLEGLGRRRQCLRGCVSLDEVHCCVHNDFL